MQYVVLYMPTAARTVGGPRHYQGALQFGASWWFSLGLQTAYASLLQLGDLCLATNMVRGGLLFNYCHCGALSVVKRACHQPLMLDRQLPLCGGALHATCAHQCMQGPVWYGRCIHCCGALRKLLLGMGVPAPNRGWTQH